MHLGEQLDIPACSLKLILKRLHVVIWREAIAMACDTHWWLSQEPLNRPPQCLSQLCEFECIEFTLTSFNSPDSGSMQAKSATQLLLGKACPLACIRYPAPDLGPAPQPRALHHPNPLIRANSAPLKATWLSFVRKMSIRSMRRPEAGNPLTCSVATIASRKIPLSG
jgi:hypothetical protein